MNRADNCQPEIDFVTQRAGGTSTLIDMLNRVIFPSG